MYGAAYIKQANDYLDRQPVWVKPAVIAITVILILLTLYLVIRGIGKALGLVDDGKVKFKDRDVNFKDGYGNVSNLDVEPWVSLIHDVTNNWIYSTGSRCEAYKRMVEKLNMNELRAVNTAYEAAYGESIREAMRRHWMNPCTFDTTDYAKLLETQLAQIEEM